MCKLIDGTEPVGVIPLRTPASSL